MGSSLWSKGCHTPAGLVPMGSWGWWQGTGFQKRGCSSGPERDPNYFFPAHFGLCSCVSSCGFPPTSVLMSLLECGSPGQAHNAGSVWHHDRTASHHHLPLGSSQPPIPGCHSSISPFTCHRENNGLSLKKIISTICSLDLRQWAPSADGSVQFPPALYPPLVSRERPQSHLLDFLPSQVRPWVPGKHGSL